MLMEKRFGQIESLFQIKRLMQDFLNRHKHPLPKEECVIVVKKKELTGIEYYLCRWLPNKYKEQEDKWLGSATILIGDFDGVGFNVYEDSDYEFTEYKILNWKPKHEE